MKNSFLEVPSPPLQCDLCAAIFNQGVIYTGGGIGGRMGEVGGGGGGGHMHALLWREKCTQSLMHQFHILLSERAFQ